MISPPSISSRPASRLSSVVLPQPEGPSSTRKSPSPMLRFRFSMTVRAPNFLTILLNAIDGMLSSLDGAGRDALHEELAENEIDYERRQRREQRRGHVDGIILGA